eukprot:403372024
MEEEKFERNSLSFTEANNIIDSETITQTNKKQYNLPKETLKKIEKQNQNLSLNLEQTHEYADQSITYEIETTKTSILLKYQDSSFTRFILEEENPKQKPRQIIIGNPASVKNKPQNSRQVDAKIQLLNQEGQIVISSSQPNSAVNRNNSRQLESTQISSINGDTKSKIAIQNNNRYQEEDVSESSLNQSKNEHQKEAEYQMDQSKSVKQLLKHIQSQRQLKDQQNIENQQTSNNQKNEDCQQNDQNIFNLFQSASSSLRIMNSQVNFEQDYFQSNNENIIVNSKQEYEDLVTPVLITGYLRNISTSICNYMNNTDNGSVNYTQQLLGKIRINKEGVLNETHTTNNFRPDQLILPCNTNILSKLCSNGSKNQATLQKAMIKLQISASNQSQQNDIKNDDKQQYLKKIIERTDKSHNKLKYRNVFSNEEVNMELYWDTLYIRIIKERQILSPINLQKSPSIYHGSDQVNEEQTNPSIQNTMEQKPSQPQLLISITNANAQLLTNNPNGGLLSATTLSSLNFMNQRNARQNINDPSYIGIGGGAVNSYQNTLLTPPINNNAGTRQLPQAQKFITDQFKILALRKSRDEPMQRSQSGNQIWQQQQSPYIKFKNKPIKREQSETANSNRYHKGKSQNHAANRPQTTMVTQVGNQAGNKLRVNIGNQTDLMGKTGQNFKQQFKIDLQPAFNDQLDQHNQELTYHQESMIAQSIKLNIADINTSDYQIQKQDFNNLDELKQIGGQRGMNDEPDFSRQISQSDQGNNLKKCKLPQNLCRRLIKIQSLNVPKDIIKLGKCIYEQARILELKTQPSQYLNKHNNEKK